MKINCGFIEYLKKFNKKHRADAITPALNIFSQQNIILQESN